MVDPSRDVATFLELAGRLGSLTGYGKDQSGVPLLLDLKPCCRKSLPAAFDSIMPARSVPLAAATPVLPLLNEEKCHASVPLPVIGYMLKRAPLRIHAPQTLLASMATPSAIAFGSSTLQSVLPSGANRRPRPAVDLKGPPSWDRKKL